MDAAKPSESVRHHLRHLSCRRGGLQDHTREPHNLKQRLATTAKTSTPIMASTTFATPNKAFTKAMKPFFMSSFPFSLQSSTAFNDAIQDWFAFVPVKPDILGKTTKIVNARVRAFTGNGQRLPSVGRKRSAYSPLARLRPPDRNPCSPPIAPCQT